MVAVLQILVLSINNVKHGLRQWQILGAFTFSCGGKANSLLPGLDCGYEVLRLRSAET